MQEPQAIWAFLLPTRPGLMPCQVLPQIAELWLAQNWACQGRRDAAGTEDCGPGGKPCLCRSSLAMLSPCNISEGKGICWFCAWFGCTQAGARAKAGIPDAAAEPASCRSAAAAAVTAWVSRSNAAIKMPAIRRGWHPATAAPPVQQLKSCSFLSEPETGSARQAFWRRVRKPCFSESVEI